MGFFTEVDVILQPDELTVSLIDAFEEIGPFGAGNPAPRVVLEGAEIRAIQVLKEKHLKLTIGAGSKTISGLVWNALGTELGEFLQKRNRIQN